MAPKKKSRKGAKEEPLAKCKDCASSCAPFSSECESCDGVCADCRPHAGHCKKCGEGVCEDEEEQLVTDCDNCNGLGNCCKTPCEGHGDGEKSCQEYHGCGVCLDTLECGHGPMCDTCSDDALDCRSCGHRQCSYCQLKAFRGNCDCGAGGYGDDSFSDSVSFSD